MRNIDISLLILFVFCSGYAFSQHPEDVTDENTVLTDSTTINVRTFSEEKISEFKRDSDFNYGQSPRLKLNLWQKILQWLSDLIYRFSNIPGGGRWLKILFYVIIGAIILYAILRLAKTDISKAFYRSSDRGNLEFNVVDEDIHQMDFEALIADAIDQKEYKKAIRLYYLYALKKLADQDLIQWQPGKTNLEYQQELEFRELRPSFGDLSYYFNYAWYGDFPVNQSLFDQVKAVFRDFKTIIDKK